MMVRSRGCAAFRSAWAIATASSSPACVLAASQSGRPPVAAESAAKAWGLAAMAESAPEWAAASKAWANRAWPVSLAWMLPSSLQKRVQLQASATFCGSVSPR